MSSDPTTVTSPTTTANTPLRLAVITGSTREGRFAPTVASWFLSQVAQRDDFEVDAIDLAELPLPTALQATPVVEGEWVSPALGDFTARVESADAFVVVTPEYNHGYPASLKLAIDSVYSGWRGKAVGFVSYGGVSGGLRSVEQLRQVFAEVHTVTVRDCVSFHGAWQQFDENGDPRDPEAVNAAAKVLLDQLAWWAEALRAARAKRPYGS